MPFCRYKKNQICIVLHLSVRYMSAMQLFVTLGENTVHVSWSLLVCIETNIYDYELPSDLPSYIYVFQKVYCLKH